MVLINTDTLQTYTGYYQWCNPPQQLSAWIDLILNYQVVWLENDTLFHKELFFGSQQPLIPVSSKTFRDMNEMLASKVFTTTDDNEVAFIDGSAYYRKTTSVKAWLHGILFFLAWLIMLSSILYAIIWIPYYFYQKMAHKFTLMYLRIRVIPLTAVLLILVSFSLVGMQVEESVAYLGQKTAVNVLFFLSTWLFAVLSFVSLFYAVKSMKEPISKFTRIYSLVLTISLVGTTLYWAYWGMIGIRLWTY